MAWIVGILRLAYVHALQIVKICLPGDAMQRFVERETVRQCSLACEAGVGLDELAIETLFVLQPRFINVPNEVSRLAALPGPARAGALLLEEQVRIEFQ